MCHQVFAVVAWLIAGACAVATLYPYIGYPLILRALPVQPLRTESIQSAGGSEFALLFCAYNEARALPEKISNLRQLRNAYPNLEILVYDDCSTDGSADLLEGAQAGIRVIRGDRRAGKAHGMKVLAAETDREFLVFTDANVTLGMEALDNLRTAYTDPTVGGVCGVLEYVDTEGTAVESAGGLYWRLEELIKSLESCTGNVMGADGSIFSVRSHLYPDFPDTVLDDMTVSMSVIFQGYRLIKNSDVVAYERLVAGRDDDLRRRMRIAIRCFHTHRWLRPKLRTMAVADRWRWWSHRYMRWQGGFFLGSGLVSGLLGMSLSVGWLVTLVCLGAVVILGTAGMYMRLGPLSTITHMVISILVTGIGVIRAQMGQTMTTWMPPKR